MSTSRQPGRSRKLKARVTSDSKSQGLTYTPEALATFMVERLISRWRGDEPPACLRILDPAVGDGALLHALGLALRTVWPESELVLTGVDVDPEALDSARARCMEVAPMHAIHDDFLARYEDPSLDADLIIANPPYVRAQSLDVRRAARVAKRFGLKGHKDLSHAFMMAILEIMRRNVGAYAATIIPNSMLLTAAAERVRTQLLRHALVHEVWDLGDTRLFDAAVLPMILVFSSGDGAKEEAADFFSAYTTKQPGAKVSACSALEGLRMLASSDEVGMCVSAPDEARMFALRRGELAVSEPHGNWVLRDRGQRALLEAVNARLWKRLSQVGRLKVGIKSCADAVFLRETWHDTGVEQALLLPLTTHHVARPFCAEVLTRRVLYPHVKRAGKRALIELSAYPGAQAYLHEHKRMLNKRKYLNAVGRQWYELWVPHDPGRWARDKVIWRDIDTRPTFWLDQTGSVVNGDCYWLDLNQGEHADLLWLVLALGNSDFAHHFYEATSGHQIYAGRRRYMARYLKHFPLPDPHTTQAVELIELARLLHQSPEEFERERRALNELVWAMWGLQGESFEAH